MPGFLTRDQQLITPKVTPGTPCLVLSETPERRCEMEDESASDREKERAVKSQSAWEIRGDREKSAEREKRQTDAYKQSEKVRQ